MNKDHFIKIINNTTELNFEIKSSDVSNTIQDNKVLLDIIEAISIGDVF